VGFWAEYHRCIYYSANARDFLFSAALGAGIGAELLSNVAKVTAETHVAAGIVLTASQSVETAVAPSAARSRISLRAWQRR